jgi:hypothetical protein
MIGSPWVQTLRHGDPIDTARAPCLRALRAICAPFCAEASPPTIRARCLWSRAGGA